MVHIASPIIAYYPKSPSPRCVLYILCLASEWLTSPQRPTFLWVILTLQALQRWRRRQGTLIGLKFFSYSGQRDNMRPASGRPQPWFSWSVDLIFHLRWERKLRWSVFEHCQDIMRPCFPLLSVHALSVRSLYIHTNVRNGPVPSLPRIQIPGSTRSLLKLSKKKKKSCFLLDWQRNREASVLGHLLNPGWLGSYT